MVTGAAAGAGGATGTTGSGAGVSGAFFLLKKLNIVWWRDCEGTPAGPAMKKLANILPEQQYVLSSHENGATRRRNRRIDAASRRQALEKRRRPR
jgi:hypothetical protein